jgi:hypothetical protein
VAGLVGGLFGMGLLVVGVAYVCGYFDPDPRLEEVRALQAKLTEGGFKPEKLLDKKNWDLIGDLQKKVKALPADLRRQVQTEGQSQFEAIIDDHIKQVMAMSAADRQAQLDKDIALIQMMSLLRPQNGSNSGSTAPAKNQMSDSDRTKMRNRYLSSVPVASHASRTTYFLLLQARASSRGISLPPMGH